MTALTFPCTVFSTQRKMHDRAAADMRYGDLTAAQLQKVYLLTDVSEKVDPYSGTRLTPFNVPQSRFYRPHTVKNAGTCSHQASAQLLFDEMRSLSGPFSLYSPYRQLINKMIDHLQYADGAAFSDVGLDMALRNQILEDTLEDSSLKAIGETIEKNSCYNTLAIAPDIIPQLNNALSKSRMPKFSRMKDHINGLGITVHDIYAVRIDMLALQISQNSWRAQVRYTAQDHFGLDDNDIMQKQFHQFKFFRIWFVLQRYEKFGFKPFFTDMSATIDIGGKA